MHHNPKRCFGGTSKRFLRGAALTETAMALGTLLLVVTGVFRLGVLTYFQLGAEGTSWMLARQLSLGDTLATAQTNASSLSFRQIGSADSTSSTANAPFMWMPLGFGSATAVHGGASIVLQNRQRVATTHGGVAPILTGAGVNLSSVAVEGQPYERGLYFNVAESDYNSSSWSSITNFAGSPLTQGENSPPYFVSTNYMGYCQLNASVATTLTTEWTPGGNHRAWCPSGKGVYRPLGTAEYLDAKNWNNSPNGVTSAGSIFQALACHQRYYAKAAALISSLNNSAYSLGGGDIDSIKTAMDNSINNTDGVGAISHIYAWDYNGPYTGYSAGTSMNNSFPLNPLSGCPGPTS
jgi:hypothetical protein